MSVASLESRPDRRTVVGPPAGRWGAVEAFVLVAYLSSALLFVPGAQSYRHLVRGLPFATSVLLLGWWLVRGAPVRWERPGAIALACALVILGIGLAHPDTTFFCGMTQIVFQLAITGPFFWLESQAIGPSRVRRLLGLIFLVNAASACAGLLQFHYPAQFMPPAFSENLHRADGYLESLSYTDAAGRKVFRPPGLTDMPGGAAVGCGVTAVLGLVFAARPGRRLPYRLACVALAGVGLYTLYLTLIRSTLLSVVAVFAVACLLLARQVRLRHGLFLATTASLLVVGSFLLAVTSGGAGVFQRFTGLFETGVVNSYQRSRGAFVEYTLTRAVFEYPFGAGVGRWGMMNYYFARFDANPGPPLYAEIQITGWVLDGGIPLLVAYAAAVAGALLGLYRLARGHSEVAYPALVALCMNLIVVVQANAGLSFNSAEGMQFWLVTGLVFRAAAAGSGRRRVSCPNGDR
ncbi:MAG TPA: hypothetical protein VFW33_16925 [Gemmataceae bacterium]|nr:hypothetical protein [Gemmataceae bacterium]